MSNNFMYADLSRMKELPKCVVICRTEEEARNFYHNCIQQLSEYLFWDLDDVLGIWNIYKEKTGFTLFVNYDEPESMSYCHESWFIDSGYELIEFYDLANTADIEESDMAITDLIGWLS